ncbi:DJ-1/PfpI family protein [Streptomyces sp. NEAU-S7GS2]|uniref:DJ-1/PfpI family protein n=1 Tax=Streptomyces sp. NEAU-S7GS2 TaxID=2202000 RepID=UPI000D6FD524|nr:DJ-1/PfpI family protein [Streptomyces sp. NEAU-S7GS2]AWN30399.1 thiamine biosynthesis protein ThiJ [Streptomyces sp. NEAU-S7GS2]
MTETPPAPSEAPVKTIAFVLYPGLTPLDIVGPLQVFAALADLVPGYRTVVVGERIEPMGSDTPLSLVPSHTFEEMADPYAVIVPGGLVPTLAAMADENLLRNLRETAARSQVVGSVCTGSLLLAAAGLLEGRQATTHWMYRDLLARFGATPVTRRWVEDGHFITAAGVSAGIDMALHLVGRLAGNEVARMVQLFIEYDPEPPFGPIDWTAADSGKYAPFARQLLQTALTDHPALLAHLSN